MKMVSKKAPLYGFENQQKPKGSLGTPVLVFLMSNVYDFLNNLSEKKICIIYFSFLSPFKIEF